MTALLIGLGILWLPGAVGGQPSPWYEGFEGPDVSWQPVGGNAPFRTELHQRVRGEAHTGDGCERLRIVGGNGTEVLVAHEIGRASVIGDLLPTLWIKADRPGLQLAVRVVLPHAEDPQSRRNLSTVVYGSSYSTVGRWQQLRIEDIPRLLAREVRALRAQYGPGVDPREAYVDRVLLNVYGGPGVTNVWIDDLDIAGYVPAPAGRAEPNGSSPGPGGWVSVAPTEPAARSMATGERPAEPPGRGRVKRTGSVLLIDDRPILPRIIQYQGEPLGLLRQLGFNAVWLVQPPSRETLDEAKRLGLWLVMAPPHGPQPDSADIQAPRPVVGPEYDGVLAWNLGRGLGSDELSVMKQWADQVRMSDRRQPGRPVICGPASDLRAYGRCADTLLLGRSPLGSSLELSDYGAWIRQQPQLTRPGIPIWTTVQTQPAEALRHQWANLAQALLPATFSGEQIQLLVYTALWAGSRGLWFESFSPLSAADVDTRSRALALELVNLQLEMAEPWMATGTVIAAVPGSEKGITAAVFQAEHGRLLVPVWSVPRTQYVSGQSAATRVAFVVPGVPESYNAYQLGPGRLRPLRHKRQPGGVRIVVDEIDLTTMVLLTENPLHVAGMTKRLEQASRRGAELQRESAAAKLQAVEAVLAQLPARARVANEAELLASARKSLAQCDVLLGTRDEAGAHVQAVRALLGLRVLERATWEAGLAPLHSPVASPYAVTFPTLPYHMALIERVGASRLGASLLAGGDFEDFGVMLQVGWRHFQHPEAGVEAVAELSPSAAHAGRFGLRLAAQPTDPKAAPGWLESPPLWITTPPVSVTAGQVVLVHGWVQVPQPITASVDGLLIVDSLGGEPLAERIRGTSGWQEFALYRAVPQSGTMTLSFALTGLGEAWLDDVTIRPITP